MNSLADVRDLLFETTSALVLHWRRTVFVIGGSAIGVALFVALNGLNAAGSSAIADGLASAEGVLVTARPAAGVIDNELFEQLDLASLAHVPGAQSTQLVTVGSTVLISDALPESGSSAHEAQVLTSERDFTGTRHAWPQSGEVILSSSLANHLGAIEPALPFMILVDGTPMIVIDVMPLPETLGVSPDAIVASPDILQHAQVQGYRVTALAESDRVQDVAQALPLVLSPAQPERVAILTSLPSEKVRAVVSDQTASWMNSAAWLGLVVAAGSVTLPVIMAVAERKPEIGLRRAMGFAGITITIQFTLEAFISAMAGGILGAGVGSLVQVAVCTINGWQTYVDPGLGIASIGAAVTFGIIAGSISAVLAARVSPVEALRPGI